MDKVEKVDLTTLKSQLPRGYTSAIAAKCGITRSAVSIALRGNNILHEAVQEAIKLRDFHQGQLEATKNALKK